jgi:hypothetical protein
MDIGLPLALMVDNAFCFDNQAVQIESRYARPLFRQSSREALPATIIDLEGTLGLCFGKLSVSTINQFTTIELESRYARPLFRQSSREARPTTIIDLEGTPGLCFGIRQAFCFDNQPVHNN